MRRSELVAGTPYAWKRGRRYRAEQVWVVDTSPCEWNANDQGTQPFGWTHGSAHQPQAGGSYVRVMVERRIYVATLSVRRDIAARRAQLAGRDVQVGWSFRNLNAEQLDTMEALAAMPDTDENSYVTLWVPSAVRVQAIVEPWELHQARVDEAAREQHARELARAARRREEEERAERDRRAFHGAVASAARVLTNEERDSIQLARYETGRITMSRSAFIRLASYVQGIEASER